MTNFDLTNKYQVVNVTNFNLTHKCQNVIVTNKCQSVNVTRAYDFQNCDWQISGISTTDALNICQIY